MSDAYGGALRGTLRLGAIPSVAPLRSSARSWRAPPPPA